MGQGGDAGMDIDAPGDGGPTVTGRVCIVSDARMLTSGCKNADAEGLLVKIATASARTTGTGAFQIAATGDSNSLWRVTSDAQSTPEIVPSIQQVSLSNTISAFSTTAYAALLTANGAGPVDGAGGIFIRTTHNGTPLADVTAENTQAMLILYDGNSATQWQQSSATSTNGVVWLPNLPAGDQQITLTPADGDPVAVTVPVAIGALTFATVAFP